MKRRQMILSSAAVGTSCFAVEKVQQGKDEKDKGLNYINPYEDVDWKTWETVHSMSHQHQGTTDSSRKLFHDMGYGHFAFSNYYPSAPTELPGEFREAHPEIAWAPNAEQHSFLDTGLHFNSLGSRLATGYGRSLSRSIRKQSPLLHQFTVPHLFRESHPWEGAYRLDIRLAEIAKAKGDETSASLTVEGAHSCSRTKSFEDTGPIRQHSLPAGNHTFYLRANSEELDLKLEYDPSKIEVTQCRLMQGTNRPWRDMFRAALDGEEDNGKLNGGLLHPDGGGITLNHPTGKLEGYLEMLDFDSRVLGIEVWNQLTSGFGSNRGFYNSMKEPPSHFYALWDSILATGRRCWGFFVKDHNTHGRGRNVLLTPPLQDFSQDNRDATTLQSYRKGTFFGSIAAIASDGKGNVVAPFDFSPFRFSKINLRRTPDGRAEAVEVVVSGNDKEKRPRIQIRFMTDKGVAAVVDSAEGEFAIPSDAPRFIRVEAFAYPENHLQGQPLTKEALTKMSVAEIARLHDHFAERGSSTFFGNSAEIRTPIPIVDQIFSQPIQQIS